MSNPPPEPDRREADYTEILTKLAAEVSQQGEAAVGVLHGEASYLEFQDGTIIPVYVRRRQYDTHFTVYVGAVKDPERGGSFTCLQLVPYLTLGKIALRILHRYRAMREGQRVAESIRKEYDLHVLPRETPEGSYKLGVVEDTHGALVLVVRVKVTPELARKALDGILAAGVSVKAE